MTDTRTFPFPLTNAEDKRRLEAIRDAGEWRGWKIKEIVVQPATDGCTIADIIVYDHERNTAPVIEVISSDDCCDGSGCRICDRGYYG